MTLRKRKADEDVEEVPVGAEALQSPAKKRKIAPTTTKNTRKTSKSHKDTVERVTKRHRAQAHIEKQQANAASIITETATTTATATTTTTATTTATATGTATATAANSTITTNVTSNASGNTKDTVAKAASAKTARRTKQAEAVVPSPSRNKPTRKGANPKKNSVVTSKPTQPRTTQSRRQKKLEKRLTTTSVDGLDPNLCQDPKRRVTRSMAKKGYSIEPSKKPIQQQHVLPSDVEPRDNGGEASQPAIPEPSQPRAQEDSLVSDRRITETDSTGEQSVSRASLAPIPSPANPVKPSEPVPEQPSKKRKHAIAMAVDADASTSGTTYFTPDDSDRPTKRRELAFLEDQENAAVADETRIAANPEAAGSPATDSATSSTFTQTTASSPDVVHTPTLAPEVASPSKPLSTKAEATHPETPESRLQDCEAPQADVGNVVYGPQYCAYYAAGSPATTAVTITTEKKTLDGKTGLPVPPEIVLEICEYLDVASINRLRRTSKQLRHTIDSRFMLYKAAAMEENKAGNQNTRSDKIVRDAYRLSTDHKVAASLGIPADFGFEAIKRYLHWGGPIATEKKIK